MHEPPSDPREDLLAERLQADAALIRPAFSAPLHARLCRAVRVAPEAERRAPPRARWLLAGAVAVVFAMVTGAVVWRIVVRPGQSLMDELAAGSAVTPPEERRKEPSPETPLNPSAITALAAASPGELSEAIDSAALASPLEALGRDAQSALEFLRTTFPPSAATWATFDAGAPAAQEESPGAS